MLTVISFVEHYLQVLFSPRIFVKQYINPLQNAAVSSAEKHVAVIGAGFAAIFLAAGMKLTGLLFPIAVYSQIIPISLVMFLILRSRNISFQQCAVLIAIFYNTILLLGDIMLATMLITNNSINAVVSIVWVISWTYTFFVSMPLMVSATSGHGFALSLCIQLLSFVIGAVPYMYVLEHALQNPHFLTLIMSAKP